MDIYIYNIMMYIINNLISRNCNILIIILKLSLNKIHILNNLIFIESILIVIDT